MRFGRCSREKSDEGASKRDKAKCKGALDLALGKTVGLAQGAEDEALVGWRSPGQNENLSSFPGNGSSKIGYYTEYASPLLPHLVI